MDTLARRQDAVNIARLRGMIAVAEGKIDTTFLISHRMALEDGPKGYKLSHDEQDTTTKIVLKPDMAAAAA